MYRHQLDYDMLLCDSRKPDLSANIFSIVCSDVFNLIQITTLENTECYYILKIVSYTLFIKRFS